MIPDLAWLTGELLVEVAKRDYSWAFMFSNGGCITTEQEWRLVANGRVAVASKDHGQLFGLSVPVDASTRVLSATKEKQVSDVRVIEKTGDLSLFFGSDTQLEFLTLSCGFESWRAIYERCDLICLGGGTLHRNEKRG